MNTSIHISIDDVKGIFKFLSKEQPKSIFDTRTLNFLRELHVLYGAEFTLYCTMTDTGYEFCDFTDVYLHEFKKNIDWLHFGFHCYSEYEDVTLISVEEFSKRFVRFYDNVLRITGQSTPPDALRLHRFLGTQDICRYLKNSGVETLLTADDDRISYCLSEEEKKYINQNGELFCDRIQMIFRRSCTRLENTKDIIAEISKLKNAGWNRFYVFTHEIAVDRVCVRKEMIKCCKYGLGLC